MNIWLDLNCTPRDRLDDSGSIGTGFDQGLWFGKVLSQDLDAQMWWGVEALHEFWQAWFNRCSAGRVIVERQLVLGSMSSSCSLPQAMSQDAEYSVLDRRLKWRKFAIVLMVIATIASGLWLRHGPEPSYQGLTARARILETARCYSGLASDDFQAASVAIGEIGTRFWHQIFVTDTTHVVRWPDRGLCDADQAKHDLLARQHFLEKTKAPASRHAGLIAANRAGLDQIEMTGTMRKPVLKSWFGKTPVIDGLLSQGEWGDGTEIDDFKNWTAEFLPVSQGRDLSLHGWVKHDADGLYFAFLVTDDLLYGIDTKRWLPKENLKAHELSRDGFPWFGNEMELLLNAPNQWQGDESADGDSASWQMVCNVTKSRLRGIGTGGLLEGEPRASESAWNVYQRWIREGAQKAAVKVRTDGKGYVIEWAVKFNPCVELSPGRFYSPQLGEADVGFNIAVGDLDTPENGAGQFGGFHHEQWWAGARNTRTQKNNFGTLRLVGTQRKR